MKTLKIIFCIATILMPICFTLAEDSVAVEGKVILSATGAGIGAFTVKAYRTESPSSPSAAASRTDRALAQTLTSDNGTYSLKIPTGINTVILQCEKVSYFSVPPQQTVALTPPKTSVPDVAAVKYEYGYGKSVSTQDVLKAFTIRQASFDAIAGTLPPSERESARRKFIESDILSLEKARVDSQTITAVKTKFLPP
jgi:hypothetical protein